MREATSAAAAALTTVQQKASKNQKPKTKKPKRANDRRRRTVDRIITARWLTDFRTHTHTQTRIDFSMIRVVQQKHRKKEVWPEKKYPSKVRSAISSITDHHKKGVWWASANNNNNDEEEEKNWKLKLVFNSDHYLKSNLKTSAAVVVMIKLPNCCTVRVLLSYIAAAANYLSSFYLAAKHH